MAGRTPEEATRNFIDPLQKSISCVTDAVLVTTGYYQRLEPHALTLSPRDSPLRVAAGQNALRLRVTLHFRHAQAAGSLGPWRVSTAGYWYTLSAPDERELISYHWHPNASGEISYPHVHLGPLAAVGHTQLARAHAPTGRVALEDVLRFAIQDLGVRSRRTDWDSVLAEILAIFEQARTW